MSNVVFSVESLEDCLEEMQPLLLDHWGEVAMYQDKVPYDPDWDKYIQLQKLGIIHVVIARDEGKMIGYFISVVSPSLHYKTTVYAVNDVLYVIPSYREGRASYDMFKYAEKELKALGVDVITIHMKVYVPFDGLCKSLGYENVERLYMKYIGD